MAVKKRFNVKIEHKKLGEQETKTYTFSFLNEELKDDAFMDKIHKYLEEQYGETTTVATEKFVNKTFYHKVK
jgi:hypothetical protein